MADVLIPLEDFIELMNGGDGVNAVKAKYWQTKPPIVLHGLVFTMDDLNPEGTLSQDEVVARYEKITPLLEEGEGQEEIGEFVHAKLEELLQS